MGEVMPFIEEILNTIQTIICDLQPQQVKLCKLFFSVMNTVKCQARLQRFLDFPPYLECGCFFFRFTHSTKQLGT